jgi:hypothetical protein
LVSSDMPQMKLDNLDDHHVHNLHHYVPLSTFTPCHGIATTNLTLDVARNNLVLMFKLGWCMNRKCSWP